VSAKADGFASLAATNVVVTNHQTAHMDLSLARSTSDLSAADSGMSPAVAKALEAMQKRIDQLEAELKNRNVQERPDVASAVVPANAVEQPPRTLLASITRDPNAIPVLPGTLARAEATAIAGASAPAPQTGKAQVPRPPTPVAPKEHVIPDALQAPDSTPGVDNFTPFAYGDFTWLNATPRNKDTVLDTKFFTPEVRFDTHYMEDFNQPIDHTIVGATESFRSGEVQI
jgi:hypothetical protein